MAEWRETKVVILAAGYREINVEFMEADGEEKKQKLCRRD